jgi:hypothetical protein
VMRAESQSQPMPMDRSAGWIGTCLCLSAGLPLPSVLLRHRPVQEASKHMHAWRSSGRSSRYKTRASGTAATRRSRPSIVYVYPPPALPTGCPARSVKAGRAQVGRGVASWPMCLKRKKNSPTVCVNVRCVTNKFDHKDVMTLASPVFLN